MINDCEQCQAHDDRTRELMKELFHPDEIDAVIFTFASFMKGVAEERNSLNTRDRKQMMKKLFLTQRFDFMGAIVGKYVLSLDGEHRDRIDKALEKLKLPKFNLVHERCPHRPNPLAIANPKSGEPE
jgi:hypothetical protein